MEPLDARYPFLRSAKAAVESADVDLASVATTVEGAAVERALDRVVSAIEGGTVGDHHGSTRVELLSYPIARILVSIVDEPGLTRRYAEAEARTALERFRVDRGSPELRSVSARRLRLADLLEEFDLADAVVEVDGAYRVAVGAYLDLAEGLEGDRWRLVNRALADGAVPVDRPELETLLREVIRARIERDLPLSVPPGVVESLEDPVGSVRAHLADRSLGRDFDAIEPALFPPCIEALLERSEATGVGGAHSRFALASFLAAIGMDQTEIAERLGEADGSAPYGLDRIHDGEAGVYPPPSCATMVAYGDCVNPDELCATIGHPLEYYERRLDRPTASPSAVADPHS